MSTYDVRLGRLPATDRQDHDYPIRTLVPEAVSPLSYRYWYNPQKLNQGDTPQCVAYSWTSFLCASPMTEKFDTLGGAPWCQKVYDHAQQVDEFAGPPPAYDGTSVRAGAKALASMGLIGAYHWAFTAKDAADAVLTVGPVVLGVEWYRGFMAPDAHGFIDMTGGVVGGHAILMDGVNVKDGFCRLHNSWGDGWGKAGYCYLLLEDLDHLLAAQGEACIGTQVATLPKE